MDFFVPGILVSVVILLLLAALMVFGLYHFVLWIRGRFRQDLAREPEMTLDSKDDPDGLASLAGENSRAETSDAGEGAAGQEKAAGRQVPAETGRRLAAPAKEFFMDGLFGRSIIIACITLGLLIPLAFVSDIVDERSYMRRKAVDDIAALWGASQTVSGPALVIPYKREYEVRETVSDEHGKKEKIVMRKAYAQEHRVVLPRRADFEAVLHPQVRHRGIYEYVVYTSPVTVKGTFRIPQADSFGENVAEIQWDKARFTIGITDLKAITSVDPLIWDGSESPAYSPGGEIGGLLGPGFHTRVALDSGSPGQDRDFSMAVNLNGSGGLQFTTVGETTSIRITGDWPHPSFSGSLLPTSRSVTDTSFSGEWHVPHLSRTYPQSGVLGQGDFSPKSDSIRSFVAGVNLFETVSLYSQVYRSVKYAILFIGLTFVALLTFELAYKTRLHLMQYALVGIAMTLFYLVLLSLAEHTSFLLAFIAASLISIGMNGLYITAAMRSRNKGLVITALLTALYLLLYALLQMEEYALLVGTFMVLTVVGVLMYLTRHLPLRQQAGAEPRNAHAGVFGRLGRRKNEK